MTMEGSSARNAIRSVSRAWRRDDCVTKTVDLEGALVGHFSPAIMPRCCVFTWAHRSSRRHDRFARCPDRCAHRATTGRPVNSTPVAPSTVTPGSSRPDPGPGHLGGGAIKDTYASALFWNVTRRAAPINLERLSECSLPARGADSHLTSLSLPETGVIQDETHPSDVTSPNPPSASQQKTMAGVSFLRQIALPTPRPQLRLPPGVTVRGYQPYKSQHALQAQLEDLDRPNIPPSPGGRLR